MNRLRRVTVAALSALSALALLALLAGCASGGTVGVSGRGAQERTAAPGSGAAPEPGATVPGPGATAGPGGARAPLAGRIYVGLAEANRVALVDLGTQQVLQVAEVGPQHHGLALGAGGGLLVVPSMVTNSNLYLVAPDTLTLRETVPAGGISHHGATDPRGRYTFVTVAPDTLQVLDPQGREVKRIAVGKGPFLPAVSADGRRVYVTLQGENAVAVVDVEQLAPVGVIPLPGGPDHLAVAPTGDRLYVALVSQAVAEVDPVQRRVLRTFPIDGPGHGVSVSGDGRWVYASVPDGDVVAMIDTRTGRIRSLPVSGGPNHIERTPDGRYMIVTRTAANAITAFHADTGEVAASIDVGFPPHQFAFAPGPAGGEGAGIGGGGGGAEDIGTGDGPGDGPDSRLANAATLLRAQPDLGENRDPSPWLLSDTGGDGAGWSTVPAEVRLVVGAEPFLAAGLRPGRLAARGWRYVEGSAGLHGHHPTPGRLIRAESVA